MLKKISLPCNECLFGTCLLKTTDYFKDLQSMRDLHDGVEMVRHEQGNRAMPAVSLLIFVNQCQHPLADPRPAKLVGSHCPTADRQEIFRIFDAPGGGVVQVSAAGVQDRVHKDETTKNGKGCGPNQKFL